MVDWIQSLHLSPDYVRLRYCIFSANGKGSIPLNLAADCRMELRNGR